MEDTQSDQAESFELDASYSDDVDNELLDGEEIESDSDQIHLPFSTAQFKRSNRIGKRSIDGPSAYRNEQ
jgi:hypothetical protein